MSRSSVITILLTLLCISNSLFSQNKAVNRDKYRINIVQTEKPITVDGILDEEPWVISRAYAEISARDTD